MADNFGDGSGIVSGLFTNQFPKDFPSVFTRLYLPFLPRVEIIEFRCSRKREFAKGFTGVVTGWCGRLINNSVRFFILLLHT